MSPAQFSPMTASCDVMPQYHMHSKETELLYSVLPTSVPFQLTHHDQELIKYSSFNILFQVYYINGIIQCTTLGFWILETYGSITLKYHIYQPNRTHPPPTTTYPPPTITHPSIPQYILRRVILLVVCIKSPSSMILFILRLYENCLSFHPFPSSKHCHILLLTLLQIHDLFFKILLAVFMYIHIHAYS